MRGLDHAVYYREGLSAPVMNCGHPTVRRMLLACLRHWAAEYCCQGFMITNAENIAQVGRAGPGRPGWRWCVRTGWAW